MTATGLASVRRVEHCMGTVFTIEVRDSDFDGQAVDEVLRWLHWVDTTFSTYQPDSQISRLGRGELTVAQCAPQVREVLQLCDQLHDVSFGYFSAYATGALDPSGAVKGWAIEQASELLRRAGSDNHCINGGGDVQCAGQYAPGQPWRIGITHPLRPGYLAGTVVGSDLAVATSGTAERGQHILDPHTGEHPTALASVTVIGPRLTYADAYATAAFAMGDAACAWIEDLPDYSAFGVMADGSTWRSP